jgi:clathrin heavy chain
VLAKNAQQGLQAVQTWLQENKLSPSEDLGDLLKNANIKLALSVYVRSNVHEKVISCFLSMGAQAQDDATAIENFNNVLNYAIRVSFSPDYPLLVSQLLRVQPNRAKDFALLLLNHADGPKLEITQTVNLFIQQNDVKNTTEIILKYLRPRGDQEEDAQLQTQVLEINLRAGSWEVVQAIFDSPDYNWSFFDKMHIARLSEQGGLFKFALEMYTDINDVKRVMQNAARIDFQYLVQYFGRLETLDAIDILRDMMRTSANRNLKLVVEVSRTWSEKFGALELIKVFEEFQAYNGTYFFLKGEIVAQSEDPVVVFKFIEAATQLAQLGDVEAVCRDHQHYDAKEVKEFLISRNLKDPRPLIHVCDLNGYVDELTQYLHQNHFEKFLLAYVQRLNPDACPTVLGTLLDMNAPEEYIRNLMAGVRPPVGSEDFVTRLVAECEKRNRLKLLRTWIEERIKEGSQDPPLHSGLAKIYIELNLSPQQFLRENQFYDAKVVGEFCESRDPHLAMIVYRRANGACDEDFIRVSSEHGLFKDQARYLVEQQNNDLWDKVLSPDNQHRREVIDQVVSTALPECNEAERVSNTVKAFMAASLPNELIELLERLIIHGSSDGEFATNTNLQNLLILTAIKADTKRVQGYADRLQHYDGPDIAKIALSDDYQLFEEAFFIFKKFKRGEEAIQVLLDQLNALDRAQEFAEYWDQPDVWSILGKAQLDRMMVKEAIASFLKADDATHFQAVIFASKNNESYSELITFLTMARQKTRDSSLDNELVYAFAKTDRLTDLEEFIVGSHMAKLSDVGEQCFEQELYHAAKILYKQINNNAKLAVCLVKLDQFDEAVDAARQAGNIATWKAVCFSCVDAGKFTLAQRCGIQIIVMMDHMNDLVKYYEQRGHFDELIALLEQGLNLDRVHQGIYTMLGVMYSRHKEDKLMDHIKFFYQRLNMTTLLQECRKSLHWNEVVFLYSHWDQYDNAVDTMIHYAADCWDNKHFKELCLQANSEVSYRAIDFYIEEHPLLLNELLSDLATKLDAGRVVHKLRTANHLPLIKSYLLNVQRDNLLLVNEAVNQILLDEDDFKGLRDSVNKYADFDQIALAQKTERHELLEFRRIAAYLYRLNKKFNKSIEVCKADEMWQDATETAAESKSPELAENLLRFFVAEGNSSSFAATMYACYDLLRADIVMELAWRNGLMDVAMPFMIQSVFDYDSKLNAVSAKLDAIEKKTSDEEAARAAMEEEEQELYNPVIATNLLAPPPGMGGGMMQPPMGMGMGMGGNMGMNNGMGMGDPNMGGFNQGMGGGMY